MRLRQDHDFALMSLRMAIFIWMTFICSAAEAEQFVTVLVPESRGVYLEVAEAFRDAANKDAGPWRIRLGHPSEFADDGQDALIVALGTEVLRHVLSSKTTTPILSLLVPRLSFQKLAADFATPRRRVSAIYLDQPAARQLRLLQLALPAHDRIGVIAGPASKALAEDMADGSQGASQQVLIQPVASRDQLFTTLDMLAGQVDVLLLLPDPLVVSSQTLPTMLLDTYRHRLPVVGYSAALVKAGALLGLYASSEQAGKEAWRWFLDWQTDKQWRLPAPPASYTVEINNNVARSLGLDLPSADSLTKHLR